MDLPEDEDLLCLSICYFEKTLSLPQFSVPPLAVPPALRAVLRVEPFTCTFFCPMPSGVITWAGILVWPLVSANGRALKRPMCCLYLIAKQQKAKRFRQPEQVIHGRKVKRSSGEDATGSTETFDIVETFMPLVITDGMILGLLTT
ncbi:hypothetical protein llap_4432 [Limosa lapponica baueri]|uniref:Uncharacterized protein n=1 Tax=Limosa lapponica baueri TaxID=1758121 RepID=A0A2I0UGU6_LIMLA|nr:hypothetical protein llap_4432 [Limosa lapponica baueri]